MNKYRKALNHIISCDREDCGVSNLSDAYRNDIDVLSELIRRYEDEELVEWHPYPEEKPSCGDGRGEETYLVSTKADTIHVAYWEKFNGGFWHGTCGLAVTAWKELPKPYRRPV